MDQGSLAVAVVQRQIMLVQGKFPCAASSNDSPQRSFVNIVPLPPYLSPITAARTHEYHDRSLDVYIYHPFGDSEGLFITPQTSIACIASKDLITIFPRTDIIAAPKHSMVKQLPKALSERLEMSSRHQNRLEKL